MPIDTRNKRASAVHVGVPHRGLLPLPDGTVAAADWVQTARFYAGIQPAEPAIENPARRRFHAFWAIPIGPTHVRVY